MTTPLDRTIQTLARSLAPQRGSADGTPHAYLMQGVVVGIHLGGLDILIRGTATAAENVRYLTGYRPGFGDAVWVARFGSDMICLGDLTTQPGTTNQPSIGDWHEFGASGEPPLLNSWVHWGAPFETPGYCVQSDGWVRLKGLVKSGSAASAVIATMPPELSPPITWGGAGISNGASCSVTIATNGDISVPAGGSTSYVALDGFTWPTVDTWERERDANWFSLIRTLNGWSADDSDINVYPMIYRRADGWRYLKGNMQSGTATAGTFVASTHLLPDDAPAFSEMLNCREIGVGHARADVRGLQGTLGRVTGGSGVIILANTQYWSRVGESSFSVDPAFPHKSMQTWTGLSYTNGWTDWNNGSAGRTEWRKGQYFVDDFGVCHVRGLLDGTSKTTDFFATLPDGARPKATLLFPAVRFNASGGVQGRINVNADGTMEAFGAVANWHQVSLAFKVDQ